MYPYDVFRLQNDIDFENLVVDRIGFLVTQSVIIIIIKKKSDRKSQCIFLNVKILVSSSVT